jgi:SAM-dependent methyltransferase
MTQTNTPELRSQHQIIDYLSSFDLFKGNEYEGYFYAKEALMRFLKTIQMVPPASAPGARLLELGANPYFITLLLKHFHAYELTLANYFGPAEPASEASQTIHSARYGETHHFHYQHFNVEHDDYPYADNSFDGVLFCEILEHLTFNPTHTLAEIHRVLKPGGFVIVTTPNLLRWQHLKDLALGRTINDPYSGYGVYGRHNREYTPGEVIRLLEDCGYSVEYASLGNIHHRTLEQYMMSAIRAHWCEHTFVFARANRPRRYRFKPWLYRSMAGMRRVTSPLVVMGENDELHIGLGWFPDAMHAEPPEPFRWTQQAAEIFLRARGGETHLTAEISGGPEMLGPVDVTLRCNTAEQTATLHGDTWVPLSLDIPSCAPGDEVRLIIEVDKLRCPARVGFNEDPRELGVLVQRVYLTSSADAVP